MLRRLAQLVAALIALAIAAVAAIVVANWAPDLPVSALAARWAPPPSAFLGIDGMQVHLRDEGPRDDSLPIVLLHGTSASLHTWEGWAAGLRATRRVISLDLPGFGLTGPFPDGDYSMAHYVQFLTHLLDTLGVKRAVVGGNSFGGGLAWRLAVAEPPRVARLVLVDASGFASTPASLPIGFRLAQVRWLAPALRNVLPRSVVERSVRSVYGDTTRITAALVDRYFDLTRRTGNRASLRERFAQMKPGELSERIAGITAPTLILWGALDRLIPVENGEALHRAIKPSTLVVFDGLGHVPHEEDPARTLPRVKKFLGVP